MGVNRCVFVAGKRRLNMSVQVANSGGSEPKLQSKVAYSSFLYSQYIQPDSGYDGLSGVSL